MTVNSVFGKVRRQITDFTLKQELGAFDVILYVSSWYRT